MVLIPKPQHSEYLNKVLLKTVYVVSEQDVKNNATIGDIWMVKNDIKNLSTTEKNIKN